MAPQHKTHFDLNTNLARLKQANVPTWMIDANNELIDIASILGAVRLSASKRNFVLNPLHNFLMEDAASDSTHLTRLLCLVLGQTHYESALQPRVQAHLARHSEQVPTPATDEPHAPQTIYRGSTLDSFASELREFSQQRQQHLHELITPATASLRQLPLLISTAQNAVNSDLIFKVYKAQLDALHVSSATQTFLQQEIQRFTQHIPENDSHPKALNTLIEKLAHEAIELEEIAGKLEALGRQGSIFSGRTQLPKHPMLHLLSETGDSSQRLTPVITAVICWLADISMRGRRQRSLTLVTPDFTELPWGELYQTTQRGISHLSVQESGDHRAGRAQQSSLRS